MRVLIRDMLFSKSREILLSTAKYRPEKNVCIAMIQITFILHFQIWTDVLLQWNPDDFGGVDHVRVPTGQVWTPDIVLYN